MTVKYAIGVDIGGTTITAGAVTLDGRHRTALRTEATRSERGADAIIEHIGQMVDGIVADVRRESGAGKDDFLGIGVGAPGPLDREKGIVIVAPNLGWIDLPLRDRITARTGLPATLDNDANCATLGEWWLGAAQGGHNVLGLTLGTGIGGGLIIGGRLYHGSSDVAGEVGHMTIEANGRRCNCGNYGCLEAYASGPAIAERAREALSNGEPSSLRDHVEGDLAKVTAQNVYAAAGQGDPIARDVVRDTARFLGIGVANLLNAFNPDVVVLAGGVAQAGDALFDPLRTEVVRRAFRPAVQACRIVPGTLGSAAGVVGAVATFAHQRGLA